MTQSIPIIDFSNFRSEPEKVAHEVMEACKSIGFFYMINHDIPTSDIDNAFKLSKKFFDLPSDYKKKFEITKANHGYSELYGQSLDPEHQQQGDHKEGFNMRSFTNGKPFAPLPSVFNENKVFLEKFSQTCHNTALQVLEAFGIALEFPEEVGGKNFFSDKHNNEGNVSVLRFLKYPRGGEKNYKEHVRAGAHSDYGSITLLFTKDIPGLEVQANRTEWIQAPLVPYSIIVNVGDQMELWTNGLFKSTMHRVTFLPEHDHLDRYSIPYFVHPDNNIPLVPAPSKYVDQKVEINGGRAYTAGEHLNARLNASHGFDKDSK